MKRWILFAVVLIPFVLSGQEENKFGIKFSGFVKTDMFFDSRQTVDARLGHFLLYPANEALDDNGDDINARHKFNILAIQTRLTGKITGPDALGAKTSGLIEGAFFGNIATDINGFRLRHAFINLDWEKASLRVGQFWHPMFVTSCFPGTVSFNTGAPFQPFARNPQIRFTQKLGKMNIIATAMEQVDFTDGGPVGSTPRYLINNGFPELNLRLEYQTDEFLFGVGGNYKSLLPRMAINNANDEFGYASTFKTDETVAGTSAFGYLKYKTDPLTFKLYGVYGQLLQSMTMLGGYAEKEITTREVEIVSPGPGPVEPVYETTGISYTPVSTMSGWVDVHTNGKTWQVGLFGAYSQNLGAADSVSIDGEFYSRGSDIEYAYRLAPRLIYNNGKFRIAPEIEYTVASYMTIDEDTGEANIDEKGKITGSKEIANFRFLLGLYYFF